MNKSYYTGKLTSSILVTIALLYFMVKTTSPRIIFVPFLVCSLSMGAKNIALLLNNEKYATIFGKLFIVGFLLFWFGFLVVAAYISIRDKSYSMIVFSVPFWVAGIYLVRNKLFGGRARSNDKRKTKFNFPIVISGALVIIALLSGVGILILGITRADGAMIFGGIFFISVALVFVIGALTVLGYFDKVKIDVLGMYAGILFVEIGGGFIALKYRETMSLAETVDAFGIMIVIPLMMIAVGVLQIIKCLRNRNRRNRDE